MSQGIRSDSNLLDGCKDKNTIMNWPNWLTILWDNIWYGRQGIQNQYGNSTPLIDQNCGKKTHYIDADPIYREKQYVVGQTKHFTVYNVLDDKMFLQMPGISMYISLAEAEELCDLLVSVIDVHHSKIEASP